MPKISSPRGPHFFSRGGTRCRTTLHDRLGALLFAMLLQFAGSTVTRNSHFRFSSGFAALSHSHSFSALRLRGGSTGDPAHFCYGTSMSVSSETLPAKKCQRYRVYLAVGSNLGDRFQNIQTALQLLCQESKQDNSNEYYISSPSPSIKLVRTSFLHETAPMYVTDQPTFLNGAVELETELQPHDLLKRIKQVESELGRNLNGIRNGPRPVDLDILLYEAKTNNGDRFEPVILEGGDGGEDLVVPHPRIQERVFVVVPLIEVAGQHLIHPVLNTTIRDILWMLKKKSSGEQEQGMVRVLPLPRGRMLHLNKTIVMGILNVTPDSFSDGGDLKDSIDLAARRALEMERQGAGIIDIGGESTRPGAKEVDARTETERTVPVIERIRKESDIPISIDTRHAEVARAAVAAGADIVNDVSGGTYDPDMLATVAELCVPMVLMHMRGTPETMHTMTDYDDIVADVAAELATQSFHAEKAAIHRWLQIVDPGIGFSKDLNGNLALLKNLKALRSATDNLPIMLGTSRKGFIGKVSKVEVPKERDPGTIASFVASLCLDSSAVDGCNIIRVHNVADNKQAAMVMDAIRHFPR